MVMPLALFISSSSNNQRQLGLTSSSNNYRNRSFSPSSSFINGGSEPVINSGVSPNYSIQKLHSNTFLPAVPSFNGSNQRITNLSSLNHSNQTNRSFNGGVQEGINGDCVSLNYPNGTYRDLTLVPSFNAYEPVMNTGFSVSSSNHRNTSFSLVPSCNGYDYEPVMNNGFPLSIRNNHQSRSLSHVPASFKIRGEPMNMTAQRRSFTRNHHFSYSARLQAAREILRARLISIFCTRSGHGFSSQGHSQINVHNSQQRRRAGVTITELDEEASSDDNQVQARSNYSGALTLAPTPVSVHHPSATNNENGVDSEDDDGITHSLPYNKYGPYTCPRCLGKFPTSQTFAAHVSSHYKYETKAQRKRRLMAKIKRRNLRLHRSREGITLLPTKPVAGPEPVNMAAAESIGDGVLAIVQIKEEPVEF